MIKRVTIEDARILASLAIRILMERLWEQMGSKRLEQSLKQDIAQN